MRVAQADEQSLNLTCQTRLTLCDRHNAAFERYDAAVERHDAAVKIDDAAVKRHDAAVKIDDAAVKRHDTAVKRHDAAVKIDDAAVKIDDAAVKRHDTAFESLHVLTNGGDIRFQILSKHGDIGSNLAPHGGNVRPQTAVERDDHADYADHADEYSRAHTENADKFRAHSVSLPRLKRLTAFYSPRCLTWFAPGRSAGRGPGGG